MKHIIEANVTKTRNEYVKMWKVSKHNTALIDYVASFRTNDREKIESNLIINDIKNQAIRTINTINRDWSNRFTKHAQAAIAEINAINTYTLAQANDLNNISAWSKRALVTAFDCDEQGIHHFPFVIAKKHFALEVFEVWIKFMLTIYSDNNERFNAMYANKRIHCTLEALTQSQ